MSLVPASLAGFLRGRTLRKSTLPIGKRSIETLFRQLWASELGGTIRLIASQMRPAASVAVRIHRKSGLLGIDLPFFDVFPQ